MGEGKGDLPPPPLDLGDLQASSVLGRGANGVVFHVRHRSFDNNHSFALKAISRSNIESKKEGGDRYRRIWFERDVLSGLRYPLLPALRGFVSTDEIIGFAMDRCSGGDLSSLRKRQTEKMFSEDIIRFYAAELVLALEHLHGLGIVYRDLKPENVLIQDSGHLMLVDFDLSTKLTTRRSPINTHDNNSVKQQQQQQQLRYPKQKRRLNKSLLFFSCNPRSAPESLEQDAMRTDSASTTSSSSSSTSSSLGLKSNSFVGTEEYVAPEIIEGTGHDFAVDWWSLGVVVYEMLYGRTPFRGQNRKETFYRILSRAPELVGEKTPLRDLIGKMLEKDPNKRVSVEGIKSHEFFQGVDWESVLEIYRPPFIPAAESGEEGGGGLEEAGGGLEEAIDVEKFVRGVFGAGNGTTTEEGTVVATTKGNRVERLSNNPTSSPDEFLVF